MRIGEESQLILTYSVTMQASRPPPLLGFLLTFSLRYATNYDGGFLARERRRQVLPEQSPGGRSASHSTLATSRSLFLIYGTGIRNRLNSFPCTINSVLIYGNPLAQELCCVQSRAGHAACCPRIRTCFKASASEVHR